MVKPNFQDCQECQYWDDVNSCWCNAKNLFDKYCDGPPEMLQEDCENEL
jgi:hypothetical protein